MGYKTKDPQEVEKLQKQGHNVIGMHPQIEKKTVIVNGTANVITTTLPGLVYEFDFGEPKEENNESIEEVQPETTDNVTEEAKPEPKKRGRRRKE